MSWPGIGFLLALILPGIVPAEISSVIALAFLLFIFVLMGWKIKSREVRLFAPLLSLIVLGLIHINVEDPRSVFRDVWILGKPAILLFVGILFGRKIGKEGALLQFLAFAALISALVHIGQAAIVYPQIQSLADFRDILGLRGSCLVPIGVALGLCSKNFFDGEAQPLLAPLGFSALCLVSLILSQSRVQMFIALFLIFAFKGWLRLRPGNLLRLLSLFVVLGFAVVLFGLSFYGGLAAIFTEIVPQEYGDMAEINQNWRGFESYRAWNQFLSGTGVQKLVGQGLGATVDLGFFMELKGQHFAEIAVLHNGFLFVLVKCGVIGLIAYGLFLFRLRPVLTFRPSGYGGPKIASADLIAALGWTLIFSTIVISGPFNASSLDPILILIGALYATQRDPERGGPSRAHGGVPSNRLPGA